MNSPAYAPPPFFATLRAIAQLRLGVALSPAVLKKFLFAIFATTAIAYLIFRRASPARFNEFTVNSLTLTLLPILCLSYCGSFLRNEIRDGTIEYLWTRPVAKYQLLLATYFCGVLTLFAAATSLTAVIHFTAAYRGVPSVWAHFPQLVIGQFGSILAYSAFALALSAYTRRFMPIGLLYGFIVEVGISKISTNINNLAISHHVRSLVNYATKESTSSPLMTNLLGLAGCTAIAAFFLVIASVIFTRTQYNIGSEKEG